MTPPSTTRTAKVERKTVDRFTGVLLGTAVGDALGLPAENLPPGRIQRLWKGKWQMRFLFGRGMISDDTEHTLMVTQALLDHPDDSRAFKRSLAWKLRWWFACLPGGVGLATAKACIRLWLGYPLSKAAVSSAGSGPAMRSAIIGAYFADDAGKRRDFVAASSQLTHKGWRAETAALAVAEAAAFAITANEVDAAAVVNRLRELSPELEWQNTIAKIESALSHRIPVSEFGKSLGLENGVSGYSLHVVPVAIYAWLTHSRDFRRAVIAAMECGGDTDTVGAIVGALCGASSGASHLHQEWLDGIIEWPRTTGVMRQMAEQLAQQSQTGIRSADAGYFWPAQIIRNALFLAVVIVHGFRRLFPPY